MDKMDRDGGNKALRRYRCRSDYVLSKLIFDNGLEDLWRRENPNSIDPLVQDPGQAGSMLI